MLGESAQDQLCKAASADQRSRFYALQWNRFPALSAALLSADGWERLDALRQIQYLKAPFAQPLVRAIRDTESAWLRWGAVDEMLEAAGVERASLIQKLNDANWWDALRLPWALARSGDSRGLEALQRAAGSSDCLIRRVATWLMLNLS